MHNVTIIILKVDKGDIFSVHISGFMQTKG